MTREDALMKLLAIEPETRSRLIAVTGWQAEDTEATLDKLVADGRVTYRNGRQGVLGERLYYPRAEKEGRSSALPGASGARRRGVRNDSGGLVREVGAVVSGWPWPAHTTGSGEEA